jgi:hypothetical protein
MPPTSAPLIIDAVMDATHHLMFFQGAAGTGKTITIKALIRALALGGKKYLSCGTTGIATVQSSGGTTLHSLCRLSIDEEFTGSFRSNIGCDSFRARDIFTANLIIIDEVSMLRRLVVNRVLMTLQSISVHDRVEFGGKMILFVGDLRQFPPVIPNFSIRKFQLQQPMRAPDAAWTDFLLSIAKDQTHEIQDWRELE